MFNVRVQGTDLPAELPAKGCDDEAVYDRPAEIPSNLWKALNQGAETQKISFCHIPHWFQ
jgi:hypothetical protein